MRFLVVLFVLLFAPFAYGQVSEDDRPSGDVLIGLAEDAIVITSGFDGTSVVVFGTVEGVDRETVNVGDYQVAVVLAGPRERIIVRQKERRAGIWINGNALAFRNVPSSYSVATSAPIDAIAAPDVLGPLHLGVDYIDARPVGLAPGEDDAKVATFRRSLVRLKESQQLYRQSDGGVQFLNPTLFRARLDVPANVPIGHHRARAYLFKDGRFITTRSVLLEVKKSGLEQGIYDLAYRNGLLYGIFAVLMAMLTGWLASVVLRKD